MYCYLRMEYRVSCGTSTKTLFPFIFRNVFPDCVITCGRVTQRDSNNDVQSVTHWVLWLTAMLSSSTECTQTCTATVKPCVREGDIGAFVWGCSIANLLLFVSFLLFRQTLSSWAPFSSTRLRALLALLNKPFPHLFIPLLLPVVVVSSELLWAPLTWQSEGTDNKAERKWITAKETGKHVFIREVWRIRPSCSRWPRVVFPFCCFMQRYFSAASTATSGQRLRQNIQQSITFPSPKVASYVCLFFGWAEIQSFNVFYLLTDWNSWWSNFSLNEPEHVRKSTSETKWQNVLY